MDADALLRLATSELEAALVRYVAQTGEAPPAYETFAVAVVNWLRDWVVSYAIDDPPVEDPEAHRRFDDAVERARRDLELLGNGADTTSQEPE